MKRLKILIIVLVIGTGLQAQFPSTDSIKRYTDKYIRNQAIDAFQNMRLNRVLKGLASQIDSSNAKIIGGTRVVDSLYVPNDSTLRFVIKNTATGASNTYTLPINATGGGGGTDTSLLNDYYVQIGDSILLWKDSTIKGSGTFTSPLGVDPTKTTHVYNVADYGIYPNGNYDGQWIALLFLVQSRKGGIIELNAGSYTISTRLDIPYYGTSTAPKQYPMIIRGQGAIKEGRYLPAVIEGGTTLKVNISSGPFILSRGGGNLTIRDVGFQNTGSSFISFIKTTGTTLRIENCGFIGRAASAAARDTGIVLGGTNLLPFDTSANACFQGYGTVITGNYFDKMERGVLGQTYANANVIENNYWWVQCGGECAIEFKGDPTNACSSNKINNNLFELLDYKYAIKMKRSNANIIANNDFYDEGDSIRYRIYLDTGSVYNTINQLYFTGAITTGVFDYEKQNTIRTGVAGDTNKIINPSIFKQTITIIGDQTPILKDASGNTNYFQAYAGGTIGMNYGPYGGALEYPFTFRRNSATSYRFELGGTAAGYSKIQTAGSDLYINQPSGRTLFFGLESTEKHRISGGTFFSKTPVEYDGVSHGSYSGTSLIDKNYADSLHSIGGSSYTFSTGLTNISNTIYANLSIGKAGGQYAQGGTAAGEFLGLSSTTHATKGLIYFGASSAYDEANVRLGIGSTSPGAPLDFGTGFGSPTIYWYNGGSTARHGMGIQGQETQFFVPNDSHFSWNGGSALNASGTNEKMRLDIATGLTVASLAGTGTRMVTASPAGLLSTQTIPSGGGITKIKNYDPSFGYGFLHHVSSSLDSLYGRALEGAQPLSISMPSAPADTIITISITRGDSISSGYIYVKDWKRMFRSQPDLTNPTGTITYDCDEGGDIQWNVTGTGARTLAFSNIRRGDKEQIYINNTSGSTITLTVPSNSRLFGTGSISTITIPTAYSCISLTKYDGTNYVFSLGTY